MLFPFKTCVIRNRIIFPLGSLRAGHNANPRVGVHVAWDADCHPISQRQGLRGPHHPHRSLFRLQHAIRLKDFIGGE